MKLAVNVGAGKFVSLNAEQLQDKSLQVVLETQGVDPRDADVTVTLNGKPITPAQLEEPASKYADARVSVNPNKVAVA